MDTKPTTREEWVEELGEAVGNYYTGRELWDDIAEFVARWIGNHNGWGDEGAMLNEVAWRREMIPESVTPEQAEHWGHWYGVADGG